MKTKSLTPPPSATVWMIFLTKSSPYVHFHKQKNTRLFAYQDTHVFSNSIDRHSQEVGVCVGQTVDRMSDKGRFVPGLPSIEVITNSWVIRIAPVCGVSECARALTHAKLPVFVLVFLVWCFLCRRCAQDGVYHTLQSAVDLFREAVGIPLEKKYNSVLFGGMIERSFTSAFLTVMHRDPLTP